MALIGEMRNLTIGGNTYSIPVSEITPATSSALGGIEIGYTTANKNYAVLLDSNSKAYVNVPWTDTTYSSQAAAKNGTAVSLVTTGEKYIWNNMLPLTGGHISGSATIDDLSAGNLIVTGDATFVQGIPFSSLNNTPTTIAGYGITDAVTKPEIDYAGVTNRTYTTVLAETTVTTATETGYRYPFAVLSTSVPSDFNSSYRFKITIDGQEIFEGSKIHSFPNAAKTSVINMIFLGNLNVSLQSDISGYSIPYDEDAQWCIASRDLVTNTNKLILFTKTTGTYVVKIEKENRNVTRIPRDLIYNIYEDALTVQYGSTSPAFSIGNNVFSDTRSSIAIGHGNIVGNSAIGIGLANSATGQLSVAIGTLNEASGVYSMAFAGNRNKASGAVSVAIGNKTQSLGTSSLSANDNTIAKNQAQFALGQFNQPDPSTNAGTERGTYVEIIGNGTDNDNRSNARTLDWSGNESIAGALTLNTTSVTLQYNTTTSALDFIFA